MPKSTVGERLRVLRVANGLSQDDVARRARRYGLNWNASRVSELERGDIEPTLSTLLVVLTSINTAGFLTMHALREVVGDESVPITSRWTLSLDAMVSLVTGDRFGEQEEGWLNPDEDRVEIDFDRLALALVAMPPGMTLRDAAALEMRPTSLAERRAAQRLRASPQIVKAWAQSLWNQSLDEQATTIANGDSAQARGQATRRLVAQLDEAMPASSREVEADG